MSLFDYIVNYFFAKKWKLDEDIQPYTYQLPISERVKYAENGDLVICRYPPYYRHHSILNYNLGLTVYIGIFNGIQIFLGNKFRKWSSTYLFKGLWLVSILGNTCLMSYEMHLAYTRIKDIKSISVREGKYMIFETWQDDFSYTLDIKDLRVISKDRGDDTQVYWFINAKDRSDLRFFVFEPNYSNTPNKKILELLLKDKRYIYTDLNKKEGNNFYNV